MSFDDLAQCLGDTNDVVIAGLIDALIARGILSRGFCLHCTRCSGADWYPLEDIGQSFRCSRCRSFVQLSRISWKAPLKQPNLYYELHEVVYQCVRQDGVLPIAMLGSFSEETQNFLFAPSQEVLEEGQAIGEVDLLAIVDGEVVIGEVTIKSDFEDRKEKLAFLRRIASVLEPDRIVLGTGAEKWSPGFMDAVKRELKQWIVETPTHVAPEWCVGRSTDNPMHPSQGG